MTLLDLRTLAGESDPSVVGALIGQKAASLVSLIQMGVPVPPAHCLGATAFEAFLAFNDMEIDYALLLEATQADRGRARRVLEATRTTITAGDFPPDLRALIDDELEKRPGQAYAVRSSGTKEDMHAASFAGLYHTALNLRGVDAVLDGIKSCWASMFTYRVLTYCLEKGVAPRQLAMGVILQEMVPAEKSGVVFTANPLTGDDKAMVVEACFGLGEALVGGEVTPDMYVYNWYRARLEERRIATKTVAHAARADGSGVEVVPLDGTRAETPVLSDAELQTLVRIALTIQAEQGFPVDVEWVQYGGAFAVVQSRPITTLRLDGIEGQWTTADFKDGGVSSAVCSPFMWSLYDYIWEKAMPTYLIQTNMLDRDDGVNWGQMFFGRPYWNAEAVKACAKNIPGFCERDFDEDLGIQVGYEGQGHRTKFSPATILRGLKVLSGSKRSFAERLRQSPEVAEHGRRRIAQLDAMDPPSLDDNTLRELYKKLIRSDYRTVETAYFTHIYDNTTVQTLFKERLKKVGGEVQFLNLTIGLRDLSHMRPNLALWRISRNIIQDPPSFQLWRDADEKAIAERLASGENGYGIADLRHYLKTYQYHSTRELDITVPNYREDPLFVITNLKKLVTLDNRNDPQALNEKQVDLFNAERAKLIAAVGFTKRAALDKKLEQMRTFLWWREELRDVSTQMYDQIRRFSLELGRRLAQRGMLDAPDDVFFLNVHDLIAILDGDLGPEQARAKLVRNRTYYRSYRNYTPPPDIGFVTADDNPAQSGGDRLQGIPSSPGVVEGRAKVIKDIYDAKRLTGGDILVTTFTDPGWTPVFGMIAGVVTETGGVLSHAAVISREYGIPAVLAVHGATSRIKDGQTIRVNGKTGGVTLC